MLSGALSSRTISMLSKRMSYASIQSYRARSKKRSRRISVGGHLGVSEGFGVPVVECRLLGRRSRVRRTSECQYRRRGWRQLGRPGPRRARRLARARGSVYRPRHGTPCPPLLPPRRPLAKREQRRERFVYLALSALARWKNRFRFSRSFFRPPAISCERLLSLPAELRVILERSAMMAGKWFVKKPRDCDEMGPSGGAWGWSFSSSPVMLKERSRFRLAVVKNGEELIV